MTKHSVNVLVKARDEASRKFLTIGGSAKIMGQAFKGVASFTKTAFAAAFKVAKYAVVGLGAALTACTYVALKQEAAEVELASALKVTGQYSDEVMKKLKEQAGAIQDVTTYGDEYVLMLMRMAITQGVTADKAADVAKAAIALHAGFGGGRGKPEVFLRYYIDALRETGSSLDSYVGALRNAKTEEERQVVLQDALARGWDAATSKAESAGGALKQMKNKLWDIAETIAWPLLPGIAKSSKAITAWAKENDANIGWWANKVFSYVTLVKDVFLDFVDFMREDWRTGMQFVFDSFLKLLKATFESAIRLSILAGKGIAAGITEGLLDWDVKKRANKLLREWAEAHGESTGLVGIRKRPLMYKAMEATFLRQAEREILEEKTKRIISGTFKGVKDAFKDAFAAIIKDMPADLREAAKKSYKEHLARLKALGVPPGKGIVGAGASAGAPTPFSLIDAFKEAVGNVIRRLPAFETRFLTRAPGARLETYQKETANNTRETFKSLRELVRETKQMARELERANRRRTPQMELVPSNL